ncbi:MAG: N-succinylarginine dihydrolase [Alphaproteobacteria bacterium]|nr:N-succinylarginine dihydrolase [Alphaproteobacteria bacterium]
MQAREWQFDGLVGPTHNYAGLALGNLAAAKNAGAVSNPRQAALQGLEKMRFVRNLGVPQAFLPPHYRPQVAVLRGLGFEGGLDQLLATAGRQAPGILAAVYSSSFMWAANAATVSPSADSADGRLHLTPANLVSHFHRSIEPQFSEHLLRQIFHNKKLFSVHNSLRPVQALGDEGAANHMRICKNHGDAGTNVFVYGKSHEMTSNPAKFPARQEQLASEAIARLHRLDPAATLMLQQSPQAIDFGVFHNDVIAMNTTNLMLVHAQAFIPGHQKKLKDFFAARPDFCFREIDARVLSVSDAVSTYLFNSELLELAGRKFALVAPSECENHAGVSAVVASLIAEGVLHDVHYLDVRESMRNGGGPACLRLRIVMTPEQEAAIHQGVVLTDEKYMQLVEWVNRHYRDRLHFDDLRDPQLVHELDVAYVALESILGMPGLYDRWRAE